MDTILFLARRDNITMGMRRFKKISMGWWEFNNVEKCVH